MNAVQDATARQILGAMVDEVLNDGDIVPRQASVEIADRIREEYPEAWYDLILQEGYRLVYEALRRGIESRRQRARHHRVAGLFGEAARSGDSDGLEVFTLWRCRIDDQNTQRCVGDMIGPDHTFVADGYGQAAKEQGMLSSFHKALAKKCGGKRTSDVMDEAEFMRLYESITGSEK